ncbi:MAG: leucine-rich repeat protein [Eubacterium sp.]|nr:leucine-rich repeat protein [Eubacterium sp.]
MRLRGVKTLLMVVSLALAAVPAGKINGKMSVVHAEEIQLTEEQKNDSVNVIIQHDTDIKLFEGEPAVVTYPNKDSSINMNGYSMRENSVYTLESVSWFQNGSLEYTSKISKGELTVYIKLAAKLGKDFIFPETIKVDYNGIKGQWTLMDRYGTSRMYYCKFSVPGASDTDINDSSYFEFPEGTSFVYNNVPVKLPVNITINGKKLEESRDYTVEYKDNKGPGIATAIFTGKGSFYGTFTVQYEILKPAEFDIDKAVVSDIPDQTYTGNVIQPSINVTYDGKNLVRGNDYTIDYKDNINVGTASVIILGKGRYFGTKLITFKIVGTTTPEPKEPAQTQDKPAAPKKGDTFIVKGYKYKITKAVSGKTAGEIAVIGATKKTVGKIVVRDLVGYSGGSYKVTSVANNAFKGCAKASSLVIGKNVKTIGVNAFAGCKSLKSVTIKSQVLNKIGSKAFKGTNNKIKFKVPKNRLTKYIKMIRKSGVSKKVKITK